MDRLDEWRVFVTVAGRRSFIAAARALGRSPQAVTRAVAGLEERLGTRLLNRTTRSVSLTDDGERYLDRGRHLLAEIDQLEARPDARAPLAGRLSITAPVLFGQLHVLPVVTELLARHPALDVRLLLYDRVVSLAEEGIDVGVRLGALPDSALRARLVGQVRSVVCASPAYLARAGVPRTPDALSKHACIAFSGTTPLADRWSFPRAGRRRERTVTVRARLVVNSAQAAIDAAVAGLGIVRVLSYQVSRLVADGTLRIILAAHEREAVPVHLVHLPGARSRAASAFVELAAERLAGRLRR
ncbi:MAG: LysR family transcriptional regulator [Polyangia bacterium]